MENDRNPIHIDTLGIRDMIAVGATTPDIFRLWIRTEKPGQMSVNAGKSQITSDNNGLTRMMIFIRL